MMDVSMRQKVILQTEDLNKTLSKLNPTVIQNTQQIQNMLSSQVYKECSPR